MSKKEVVLRKSISNLVNLHNTAVNQANSARDNANQAASDAEVNYNQVQDAINDAIQHSDVNPQFVSYDPGVEPDGSTADEGDIGLYITSEYLLQKVLRDAGTETWKPIGEPISTRKYVDDKASLSVANVADLRQTVPVKPTVSGQRVNLLGYRDIGDGGGSGDSDIYWDAYSTEADNGGTIFKVAGIDTGRWKRPSKTEINIKEFGLIEDENEDNTAPIQAAVDASKNSIINKIHFPDECGTLTAAIILDKCNNLELIGTGSSKIYHPEKYVFFSNAFWDVLPSPTENIVSGVYSFVVSDPENYSVGDMINLRSLKTWPGGNYGYGEFNEVESIDGATINFRYPFVNDHVVADLEEVWNYNLITNIHISGFQFNGKSAEDRFIQLQGVRNSSIHDIKVFGDNSLGMYRATGITAALNCNVYNCDINNSWYPNAGYGVITSGLSNKIFNNRFHNTRHPITHAARGGVSKCLEFDSNTVIGTHDTAIAQDNIDLHSNAWGCRITNNNILNGGIIIRCDDCVIEGNIIKGVPSAQVYIFLWAEKRSPDPNVGHGMMKNIQVKNNVIYVPESYSRDRVFHVLGALEDSEVSFNTIKNKSDKVILDFNVTGGTFTNKNTIVKANNIDSVGTFALISRSEGSLKFKYNDIKTTAACFNLLVDVVDVLITENELESGASGIDTVGAPTKFTLINNSYKCALGLYSKSLLGSTIVSQGNKQPENVLGVNEFASFSQRASLPIETSIIVAELPIVYDNRNAFIKVSSVYHQDTGSGPRYSYQDLTFGIQCFSTSGSIINSGAPIVTDTFSTAASALGVFSINLNGNIAEVIFTTDTNTFQRFYCKSEISQM